MDGGLGGTFVPGGPSIVCVPVPIVNDNIPENCAETFSVTLDSDDADIVSPSQAEIQILDDDGIYE